VSRTGEELDPEALAFRSRPIDDAIVYVCNWTPSTRG